MADLPSAAVKRLLVKNGAERVSASAIGMAINAAEEFLAKLAAEAALSASQDKRKTVMDADIEHARKKLLSCSEPPAPPCSTCC